MPAARPRCRPPIGPVARPARSARRPLIGRSSRLRAPRSPGCSGPAPPSTETVRQARAGAPTSPPPAFYPILSGILQLPVASEGRSGRRSLTIRSFDQPGDRPRGGVARHEERGCARGSHFMPGDVLLGVEFPDPGPVRTDRGSTVDPVVGARACPAASAGLRIHANLGRLGWRVAQPPVRTQRSPGTGAPGAESPTGAPASCSPARGA